MNTPFIVDCAALDARAVQPGKISAAGGRAGYAYIERAIHAALNNKVAGVVTAPIHKEALRLAGIAHPGHTEIFAALTKARRSCMKRNATASWRAPVLWRFWIEVEILTIVNGNLGLPSVCESARGLAHSKTLRTFDICLERTNPLA